MNVERLEKIYEDSKITEQPLSSEQYFSIFDGFKYMNIPLSTISDAEKKLLEALYDYEDEESVWKQLLLNKRMNIESEFETIQCIQFYVDKNKGVQDQWLQSFMSFFDNIIDGFYFNDHYGVVLLEKLTLSDDQLIGILDTLDVDYSTNTSVYVGMISNVQNMSLLYQEEKRRFNEVRSISRMSSFTESFLNSFSLYTINNSDIALHLRSLLQSQPELSQLIVSLWKNQGNQTAVAKEIFVHRNTINYRIDKLMEEYNINLRDVNQLFMCYILVK